MTKNPMSLLFPVTMILYISFSPYKVLKLTILIYLDCINSMVE